MKIQKINDILKINNADAILLYSPQNRYWYSRFPSSLGYLLIFDDCSYLFLDGRYVTAARTSDLIMNVDNIVEFSSGENSFYNKINEILKLKKSKKVLFESDWVYCKEEIIWKKLFNSELIGYDFSSIREVKDDWEVEKIKKACDITHKVFLDVLKFAKPGISELDLARFVSDTFLKHGAQKLSFDTIVASGENGAKPHAVPSNKIIKENEFITLDMGCYFDGYCSDQTRTFAIGNKVSSQLIEVYKIVLEAQGAGIAMIKPGVKCIDVHNKCKEIITKYGYGDYFNHGTGHGLGIEIHEEPYNAAGSIKILEKNMCVTVEPGIYIPGVGGVRIEDDILVTENGYEYLTTPLRDLQIIKVKK